MSPLDFKCIKLNSTEALKNIRRLAKAGSVAFSGHAMQRLRQRDLTTSDVMNVLQTSDSRVMGEGEFEDGSYRYRVATRMIIVVVAFNNEGTLLNIVSTMRRSKI